MRVDPIWSDLIRDCYVTNDHLDNARRFATSSEWLETLRLLGAAAQGGTVLDLGAGNGIASWALATSGAARVIAVEPDPSDVVGAGAIRVLAQGLPIEILESVAGGISVPDGSVDAVLARQVLHHIHDLPAAMSEVARIMKPGAVFVATREHVVDDARQMEAFLAAHPIHQLTGGEHAHSLDAYIDGIRSAGLELATVFAPFESIVNTFPALQSTEDLQAHVQRHVRARLRSRYGRVSAFLRRGSAEARQIACDLGSEQPGRLYTFVARKQ